MARHFLLPVLVALACAGCSEGSGRNGFAQILNTTAPTPVDPAPALLGVTLSRTSVELAVGTSETIAVTAQYSDGSTRRVTASWTSSNLAIASPDEFGVVRAVSRGVATVTASVGSVSASATVTVT